MPKAAPSTRSAGHVTLSFGLVNIPVTLYGGIVSAHGVERHEYVPAADDSNEEHLVGRGKTDKVTGELLTVDQSVNIVKKVETEYGPVYVEDGEIERLFTLEPDTLKITAFQPQHVFRQGNYVPKALQFVEPSKSGTGAKKGYMAVAVKLLGTLFEAMREEGVVAIGELTTRGVPKPVVLTPTGELWQIYHTDAVREQRELPEFNTVEAEVTMMRQLVNTLKNDEVLDLTDERSALIQGFADQKAAAGDFGKPDADTYKQSAPAEPQVDIMALLSASVEAAEKAS